MKAANFATPKLITKTLLVLRRYENNQYQGHSMIYPPDIVNFNTAEGAEYLAFVAWQVKRNNFYFGQHPRT